MCGNSRQLIASSATYVKLSAQAREGKRKEKLAVVI